MQLINQLENNQESLLLILKGLKKGVYQDRRFYILENPDNKFKDRVLLIPKDFAKTHSYKLNDLKDYATPYLSQLNKFNKKIKESLNIYTELLNSEFSVKELNKIQIKPVIWGTLGSISDDFSFIYPRIDRNPTQVFHLLVNCLIDQRLSKQHKLITQYSKNKKNWENKQLIANQVLKKLLKSSSILTHKTKSLVNILNNNSKGNLVKQSAKNYASLGYPITSLLNIKTLNKQLTPKEILILKELQNNKLEVVTFEKLSEIIWKDKATEKYSLYAITKQMQRIRKKLQSHGITENIIHTQRGKGYILFD